MEKIYHNFAGMDLDTSPEKFNPNYYSTAYNVRIGSNVGNIPVEGVDNKKGSLEGIKNIGGVLSSLFTDSTTKIISLIKLRENLVFITSNTTTQSIYNIAEKDLGTLSAGTVTPFFTWNKVDLTLNEETTTILGRYETDKLIKVYITDGDTYLKSINLAATAPTNIKQVEVFKPIDIPTSPSFTITSGGNLKAGNIAYGVQYYSLNGSASNYIPVGPITPILKGDISDAKVLTGGGLNETTDKAAVITVPYINASSGLNYARVVRIHYTILGEVPSISVVYDGPISTTIDTIVTDTGQFIDAVSPEEYALITNPFKCKTIEQKNNILFAGNILQSEFSVDYDARVKRYNYVNADTIVPYSGAFNPYNDPNVTSFVPLTKYAYKSDGHTVGGSGVNGSYSFGKYESPIFDNGNFKPIHSTNIYHKNFTRGEIYAFALVGFDEYMRPAFAKYIDDIKIPDLSESHLTFSDPITPMNRYDSGTNKYYGAGIYPIFQYANIPTDIKYVCVVRTSRENDGLIADMGTLIPIWKESKTSNRFVSPDNTDGAMATLQQNSKSLPYYYELISPKILTNKSLPTFDRIDYYYSTIGTYGAYERLNWQRDHLDRQLYTTELYSATKSIEFTRSINPIDKRYYAYNTNKDALFQIGGETIKTVTKSEGNYGFKSGCAVIQSDRILYERVPSTGYDLPPICILRKIAYPYGGYTDAAIEQRSWLISSPIVPVVGSSATISTEGFGDTYIQIAPYTRIMWDVVRADFEGNSANTCYLPFESQILLKGVAGKTFENYFSYGVSVLTQPFKLIQELKGVWTDNSTDPTLNSFTQENDLYGYNSAYSAENKSKIYITKPSIYSPQSEFDCVVKASDRKINGETIDGWTIFRPNSRIELDTSRGELNELVNLNNTLFFIQKAGAGTLSVDERELIPSSNTGNLQLGTSGVLSRFDYIFTNYGSDKATNTNNFIYFYDSSAGKFCRMNTQQADILSDTMNCKSYFSNILYSTVGGNIYGKYAIGADNIRQQVYFKPENSDGIVFDELWNNFTSLITIPFSSIFTTEDVMYFAIPYNSSLSPFTSNGGFLYGLFPYANPNTTDATSQDLEYSLPKSVEFVSSGQLPMRLDLIEWTSKNFTPLANTDIEEKYEIYEEDIMFKEFLDSNSNPNPRFFNKKRYNQIYNVNNRARCKGNYFKIKYIGNYDKLKKSNFTLNSFNVYITPLLNR